jgi:hypothetical protein
MAQLEELIAQITDERLRKAVAAEVRELKKSKKFGLVFEGHLPETVRLPELAVNEHELVTKKRDVTTAERSLSIPTLLSCAGSVAAIKSTCLSHMTIAASTHEPR